MNKLHIRQVCTLQVLYFDYNGEFEGEFEGCYSKICLWNSTVFSGLEQLKSEDTWKDTWKAISLHVMMCRFYVNKPLLAVVELGLVYKLNFNPGTRFAFHFSLFRT